MDDIFVRFSVVERKNVTKINTVGKILFFDTLISRRVIFDEKEDVKHYKAVS